MTTDDLSTTEAILDSLRRNFPLLFTDADPVDTEELRTKYNRAVEYANTVSAPSLSSETTRYQTVLLSLSTLLIALKVLHLQNITLYENTVAADRRALVWYVLLLLGVATIFLAKVYVDRKRSHFLRLKDAESLQSLWDFMFVAAAKNRIQAHHYASVFNYIGELYEKYRNAQRLSRIPQIRLESTLTRDDVAKNPQLMREELMQEWDRLEQYANALRRQVLHDAEQFYSDAYAIRRDARLDDTIAPASSSLRSVEAYDRTLGKWVEARNSVRPPAHNRLLDQFAALKAVLDPMLAVRNVYGILEIAVPVAFAIVAVIYALTGETSIGARYSVNHLF